MISEIRERYKKGENIVRLLSDRPEMCPVGFDPVMVSYDLQAGSYVKRELSDLDYAEFKKRYCKEIAENIDPLGCESLLEAGVGEGTTLGVMLNCFERNFKQVSAFDISWSRLSYAKRFLAGELNKEIPARTVQLCVGDSGAIPFADNSHEIVFTSHSIEPNRGREEEIVKELARVASRYVVMVEPAYEWASEEARNRMDYHGYCRGLLDVVKSIGLEVVEHKLLEFRMESNPSMIIIARKPPVDTVVEQEGAAWACPISGKVLSRNEGGWYTPDEGLYYPEIGGIPCLLPRYAVLISGYGHKCI